MFFRTVIVEANTDISLDNLSTHQYAEIRVMDKKLPDSYVEACNQNMSLPCDMCTLPISLNTSLKKDVLNTPCSGFETVI